MPPKKKPEPEPEPEPRTSVKQNKGRDNKKADVTSSNSSSKTKAKKAKNTKITEEKALLVQRAKENRSMDLFYKLSEVEPEEETLEQKIRRQKKELHDNTFK